MEKRINYYYFFLLIIISLGIYYNSYQNGFCIDDFACIVDNPLIKDIRNIPKLFTSLYILQEGHPSPYLYRPIASISYAVTYLINGLDPTFFHFGNALIHGINGFLVFLFGLRILKRRKLALIASLIFVLHPVQTDVVDSAVGRAGLLMTFFSLLSILCYMNLEKGKKFYYLTLLFFFLSMLSKESGTFLIVFFGFYDLAERADWNILNFIKRRYVYMIGFVLTFLLYFVIRLSVVGRVFVGNTFTFNPLIAEPKLIQIINGIKIIVYYYIRLLLYPYKLCALYAYNQIGIIKHFWDISFIVSIAVLWIIVVATIYLYKKRIKGYLGILLFFSFIFFYSNIPFLAGAIVAERFLYFPSIGFILFAISVYQAYERKIHRYLAIAFISCLLLLFATRTYLRNRDWESNLTIFKNLVETYPENARGQHYLALQYMDSEDLDLAIRHFKKSLEIFPDNNKARRLMGFVYATKWDHKKAAYYYEKGVKGEETSEVWSKIGFSYSEIDNYDKALQAYKKALEINKDDTVARYHLALLYMQQHNYKAALEQHFILLKYYPNESFLYNSIADLYWKTGQVDSAKAYWRKAIEKEEHFKYDPTKPFHFDLGLIYAEWGNSDSAIKEYKLFIKNGHDEFRLWLNLGNAYRNIRNYAKALEAYKKALSKNPENKFAHFQIAKIYYLLKDYEKARAEYRLLVDAYPDLQFLHYKLGLACQKLGDTNSAIEHFEDALKIDFNYFPAQNALMKIKK